MIIDIDDNKKYKCPSCGSTYLHHETVEIFARSEDEKNGFHTIAQSTGTVIDSDLSKNPSSRRHGISVHFSCEGCDATPVLSIVQHKGETFYEFK